MYRVVLAESDASVCQRISRAFAGDQRFRVIANSDDPDRTAHLVQVLKPDLLVIAMPMVEATRQNVVHAVMAKAATRVIAYGVTGSPVTELQLLQVVERGALEAIWITIGAERELVTLALKWCARPKPDARVAGPSTSGSRTANGARVTGPAPAAKPQPMRIVAIGASTGGPAAIEVLVRAWPADFAVPVVVAQHLTPGFSQDMVQWLNTLRTLRIKLAESNERLQPRTMYFAPDGMHVKVTGDDALVLSMVKDEDITVPSVDQLFGSVAEHYGSAAVGVVLTGMGDDGALGLAAMMAKGARTVAQNQATCSVFGMPQAAIKRGGVGVVLPLGDIAGYVFDCVTNRGQA